MNDSASSVLLLREPDASDLPAISEYRREFLDTGDSMDGTSNLRAYEDLQAWLDFIRRSSRRETCRSEWVPDTQYLIIRKTDGLIVGMLDLREELNEECLRYYGHIGYSVRKSERRKGYAAAALQLALNLCRQKGLNRVLITCDRENVASERTILKCGGILENELFDPGDHTITRRYWISLL